jgi:hypothetical protein
MDTVNAKKGWKIIYWRVNKFLKQSHVVTRIAKERASVLKIHDISFFGTPDCHHCYSIACLNANLMSLTNYIKSVIRPVCFIANSLPRKIWPMWKDLSVYVKRFLRFL